ncbi:MAG: polysaccharide deacetylase family protein [Kofleriaceae bacterium]
MNDVPAPCVRSIVVPRRPLPLLALALLLAFGTGAGPVKGEAPMYPRGWPQPSAGPSASGDPELILSFDDGPDPANTPPILDILRDRGIRAVFFQIGWRFQRGKVAQTLAVEQRLIREGHLVGNHTINHAHLCASTAEVVKAEVEGARALLEHATGMPVQWFRTPYGARCPSLERRLAELGLGHFHWDIDPQEWRGLSADSTARRVIWALAKLDGRAVLLMHDTKFATRYALPKILDWIDAENLRRSRTGRRPIRIVNADVLAVERIAPATGWVTQALHRGRAAIAATLAGAVP